MLTLKKSKDISPIYLGNGDTFEMSYTDESGDNHKLLSVTIEEDIIVNQVKIYKFQDEFGLKEGYCGVFGNKGD